MWFIPAAEALDQAELTKLLEDAREDGNMPGLRAAVRYSDGRVLRAAVGLADVEAGIPLNDTVGMPGGSTGKTFVAATAMLLVEEGVLSLDDPISYWLAAKPWYEELPNAEQIRVGHLLSHSSGIADYPDTMAFQVAMIWRAMRRGSAYFEPEELIGFVLNKRAPFLPGNGYRYTDAGYLVLGILLEEATGRNYYDILSERILEPMNLTDVRPADQSILIDITPGYTGGARNLREDGRMKFDPSSEWTGGGLIVNPTMLVEFFAALAEGRIVSPESFNLMLNSGWRPPEGTDTYYGIGMFVYEDGNAFGHGGLWPGYRTQVTHYFTSGVTVAIQTNRDGRVELEALADILEAATETP